MSVCNPNITAPNHKSTVPTNMSNEVDITVEIPHRTAPFPNEVKAQLSVDENNYNWISLGNSGGNVWSGMLQIAQSDLDKEHTCLVKGFVANAQCGSARVDFTPT